MKIKVPTGFPFPLIARFRVNCVRIVVVKCLKRASGSFVGMGESKREKVCFTGTGRGSSVIAPA